MSDDAADAGNCPWQLLEEHFRHHARLVNHFRHADAQAVVAMWKAGTNEAGARLSQFERDALIERHCELLGHWPEHPQENPPTGRWASRARASSDPGRKQGHTALGARSGGGETGRDGPCVALSSEHCR
jgi:hypothetical protein